ncbi:MAG: global cell cycle regulator GcrA-like protein [Alphaproteobacteria bacterium]|nr:global cell cycle regulator GcrA-like protein [Alphaproteobacteria bacterium SS10]
MTWTDERVDVLRQLWDEGKTASQIASVLGITRNAVIGKAHRIGVSRRPSPIKRRKPGATILELTDRMCKWPIGDPRDPDFRFCGKQTSNGLPYCETHCQQAYQQPSSRRRAQAEQSSTGASAGPAGR